MKARAALVAALAAALTGCAPTPEPSTAVVEVGTGLTFQVEVARTADAQRDGLSGRALSEGTGMLFPFDGPAERRQVWMAGMEIPLDAAWIVDDQVLDVDTLDPCTEADQSQCPRWTSPSAADALLEVPAGALHGIEAGTPVTITEESS